MWPHIFRQGRTKPLTSSLSCSSHFFSKNVSSIFFLILVFQVCSSPTQEGPGLGPGYVTGFLVTCKGVPLSPLYSSLISCYDSSECQLTGPANWWMPYLCKTSLHCAMTVKLINSLNFIPLWKWTWCHCISYILDHSDIGRDQNPRYYQVAKYFMRGFEKVRFNCVVKTGYNFLIPL